jgi:formylglycine-generating enzyme required for sulfatase activity
VAWSGNSEGNEPEDFCTYTEAPGSRDDHPMVCVTLEAAQGYCQARGKDLPTEAQLEYVASGLESRLFVWGSEEPDCDDAVLRRYGYGLLDIPGGGCLPDEPPGGVETVGGLLAEPRRDRLSLPGGDVFDLVGNATEWVRDRWNRQTDPCWTGGGVYLDPLCAQDSPTDGPFPVFRLGSFAVGPRQAVAAARNYISSASALLGNGIDLGFRCVRPGS